MLYEYDTGDEYTDAYWIKFSFVKDSQEAKRKLDDYPFFGQLLHVSYAPQFETVIDAREKLMERKKSVLERLQPQRYQNNNNNNNSNNSNNNNNNNKNNNNRSDNNTNNNKNMSRGKPIATTVTPAISVSDFEDPLLVSHLSIPEDKSFQSPLELTILANNQSNNNNNNNNHPTKQNSLNTATTRETTPKERDHNNTKTNLHNNNTNTNTNNDNNSNNKETNNKTNEAITTQISPLQPLPNGVTNEKSISSSSSSNQVTTNQSLSRYLPNYSSCFSCSLPLLFPFQLTSFRCCWYYNNFHAGCQSQEKTDII